MQLILLAGITIIVLALIALFEFRYYIWENKFKNTTWQDNFVDPFYNETVGNHSVFYRKQWLGQHPTEQPQTLEHPINLVIISCSFKKFCKTPKSCAKSVRKLQKAHQTENNYYDIAYNFMIGSPGCVYVGTGWDYKNFIANSSISIAFLGNFEFDELNNLMTDAYDLLIEQGLELGKLSKDFQVIGESQTNPNTLSPGVNIYKILKSWSHYSNITLF